MNGHSFIPNCSQLKESSEIKLFKIFAIILLYPGPLRTSLCHLRAHPADFKIFTDTFHYQKKSKYFQHLCGIWSDLGTIPDNRTICTNLSSPSRSHCLRTGLILTGWSIILHRRQSLNITFHHFSHKYSTFKLIYIYRNNYL